MLVAQSSVLGVKETDIILTTKHGLFSCLRKSITQAEIQSLNRGTIRKNQKIKVIVIVPLKSHPPVGHAFDPSIQESETGSQPALHCELNSQGHMEKSSLEKARTIKDLKLLPQRSQEVGNPNFDGR